jgi:shikimate kinase
MGVGRRKMLIFVVGPSKSGKTSLIRAIAPEFPTLKVLDLDLEEERCVSRIKDAGGNPGGWDDRWRRNQEFLMKAEDGKSNAIVDVGAGSLQTAKGQSFFIRRGLSMITVIAPWQEVFRRHSMRDQVEFREVEYSDERQAVYRAAKYQVDSSTDFVQSLAAFRVAVRNMIK